MLSQASFFAKLPEDPVLDIQAFLKPAEFFLLASVSNELFCLLNVFIQKIVESKWQLKAKIKDSLTEALESKRSSDKEELKLKNRVAYFLKIGMTAHDAVLIAARNGHVEVLKMIYQGGYDYISVVLGEAVAYNQPGVIEFFVRNGLVNYSSVITEVIDYRKIDLIRLLAQLGFDFANGIKNSSPLEYVLTFGFGESAEELDERFQLFQAMLECGSFPKENKKAFLEWLDDQFERVQPRFSSFSFHYFPMYSSEELDIICKKFEMIPIFEKAFAAFKEKVEFALDYFEPKYRKSVAAFKELTEKKARNKEDKAIEMTTFKKTLL